MITDSVRRRGVIPNASADGRVSDAMAVVLARQDDTVARRVVQALHSTVGDALPVVFWSHRDLIDAAYRVQALRAWADELGKRYLGPDWRTT
jgi:hypothetical protein